MISRLNFILTFAAAVSLCASARAQVLSDAAQHSIRTGLDSIYSMNFPAAELEFKKILAESPDHPYYYFGMAAAAWTKVVYGSDESNPEEEKEFMRRVETAVNKSEIWLKSHPKDAGAMIALGGSYGLRSRLMINHKNWIRAVLDGRRALKATEHAHQADPDLYDAYLGIGMWEYYADVFPRFVKSLGRMFLGGDRKLGIRHLEMAADKAKFIPITAKLILIEIYMRDRFGAKDPKRALEIIRSLRKEYPGSPLFQQIEQVCLFASGDLEGVLESVQDYMQRVRDGEPNYDAMHYARMWVTIGTVRMARKDLVRAREAFQKGVAYVGTRESPNWWGLWGLVRLGQVEDLLGDRDSAKFRYKTVLLYNDVWGYHLYAKEYLAHPFKADDNPIELPPP